mmetsp:Transcript_5989/g.12154  ORF Transcript_5989/g.12154 Transcript_5989/m.12154 type:complete len:87 (-) Transcript_5989:93-353(-)
MPAEGGSYSTSVGRPNAETKARDANGVEYRWGAGDEWLLLWLRSLSLPREEVVWEALRRRWRSSLGIRGDDDDVVAAAAVVVVLAA